MYYDKIKLFIPMSSTTQDVASTLVDPIQQTDLMTGETSVMGHLDNMRVKLQASGIWVEGSLSRFLYGSNIYSLDKHTTGQALEKLGDAMQLDVMNAKLSAVEFGQTFVMRNQPAAYMSKLGSLARMQRLNLDDGTLYYKGVARYPPKMLCFYDKAAEMMGKGVELPPGLQDANLLRYELRYKNRLASQLGYKYLYASHLVDADFYRLLLKRWQDLYFSIKKQQGINSNMLEQIKKPKDAERLFVARLINQGNGQNEIASFIQELKAGNVFSDRKNYTRLKKQLESLASIAGDVQSDELVKELDNEIVNAGAYM